VAWFKRITLFVIVNILVMITISFILNLLGVGPYISRYSVGGQQLDYQNLMIFCLVWGMVGSFISLGLSRTMAKMFMRVQVINPSTATGPQKELVDMVHRFAKTSGITTMPEVGIYDSPEINAFATGPTKNRALVAVSTGLLNRMDRDQVEGVIGHEMAHISNGDMVTMTLLQGIINAFVMFIARVVAFALAQNAKEENRFMIRMAVTFLLEIVLSILGAMVVAYFSRLREFRADAGGARFAGREKMISALKGLQGTLNRIDNDHPSMASFKISGKPGGLMALLSTHPPLEERIQRLERGL
jgi:heat shock protein HtpX